MEQRTKIFWAGLSGILIMSSILLLVFAGLVAPRNYLLDIRIPGIVEGTAKAIDTESYFTKNELITATVEMKIICNNTDNLEVSIGYKSPTEELMDASSPDKEISVWLGGDNFPAENYMQLTTNSFSNGELVGEWDLLDIGFDKTEYVKADERIWFLKIQDTSGGPYGYERNITEEINGTLVTLPDYVPNMNYIEHFGISFNGLIFQTLLHPYFDGSCDIVVPIRGVDHELVPVEDGNTQEQLAQIKGTWSSTTTTQGSIARWAVVFATEDYIWHSDAQWMAWGGNLFVFGEHSNSVERHPDGIYDHGYSVMYCSDGSESTLPTKTCSQTDESYLKQMLSQADTVCDSNDRLIVFVHCHGQRSWIGRHMTVTGSTRYYFPYTFTNVMHRDDYFDYIESITDDGTHVFLWIDACHGDGMDNWPSDKHHDKLEVWSYVKYAYQMAWSESSPYDTWDYAYWQYTHDLHKDCEAEMFFTNVESGSDDVTDEGDDIEYWFDNTLHPGSDDDMRTITYWPSSYHFYV
ncbi:MAG: hypothetical protein KGD59_02450 [Candidatus Heimdallarchaeota archaeon]|nr:hypothetical protein [Candidatus Heimdallarchaeota archaeon]MBY8993382.1 hypothetical protein [Candidatus Heimdallarchaeota archaeon]